METRPGVIGKFIGVLVLIGSLAFVTSCLPNRGDETVTVKFVDGTEKVFTGVTYWHREHHVEKSLIIRQGKRETVIVFNRIESFSAH